VASLKVSAAGQVDTVDTAISRVDQISGSKKPCRSQIVAPGEKGMGVAMKSSVVMRPIRIAGHKTSVSLEDAFWTALKSIAAAGDTSVSDLVGAIDLGRRHANLSSAIRLFILDFYKASSAARLVSESKPLASDALLQP
jgi:predicted DNA-binding ribbon-helix-helix protein